MLARTLVPPTPGITQLAAAGLAGSRISHGRGHVLQQLQLPCSSAAACWLAHRGHVRQAREDFETVSAAVLTSPQTAAAVPTAVVQPQAVAPSRAAGAAGATPATPASLPPRKPRGLLGNRQHPPRPRISQQRAPQNGAVGAAPPPVQAQQQRQVLVVPAAGPVQGNVTLRGTVSTITYASEDGFIIAKLKDVEGTTDPSAPADVLSGGAAALAAAAKTPGRHKTGSSPLTVKGAMPGVKKLDELQIRGVWEQHAKFGWQVSVLHHTVTLPTDPEALLIRCIPGVGPATAACIVAGLQGASVKEVLSSDDAVQRLSAIKGIGKKKATMIKQEWDSNTGAHEASAWLLAQHIPPDVARNLLTLHGATVRDRATQNPYALITSGTGFKLQHAEALAAAVGLSPGAPERAAAVLLHELRAAAKYSAAYSMHWQQLEAEALRKLAALGQQCNRPWPREVGLRAGAELLVQNEQVVVEEIRPRLSGQQAAHMITVAAAAGEGAGIQSQRPLQQQDEFVRVHRDWSDNALFMLTELYDAEQDVIQFYVQRSAGCHEALAKLHQQSASSSSSSNSRSASSSSSSSSGSSSSSTLPYPLVPISSEASEMIEQCEEELSVELGSEVVLNEGQRHALMLAAVAELPAVVLTGGPGCGKTLTSQAVARTWLDQDEDLSMAAPTGRAAQRLQEMVVGGKHEAAASTIHRLLGYRPPKPNEPDTLAKTAAAADAHLGGRCKYGKPHKLPSSKLLIDEVSMMDVPLAAALYNAIGHDSSLLLVGDPDQLPPVGPGRPLAAALAAGLLPCIDLRHIYRSAAGSAIVRAAHAINQGLFPSISTWDINPATPAEDLAAHLAQVPLDPTTGCLQLPSNALFLRLPDGAKAQTVADTLLQTVLQLLPQLQCDPRLDVQVLSPTKRNFCGTPALNARLQQLLNPPADSKQELHSKSHGHQAQTQDGSGSSHSTVWRVGDRVIHLENDTERDVYNGDLGYIESVYPADGSLTVRYPPRASTAENQRAHSTSSDGRIARMQPPSSSPRTVKSPGRQCHVVKYRREELHEQLQLAWAITVHKAQGGEFPIVLMPLEKSAGRLLLHRSLLYTAVSRAKQLLVLVGTQEALQHCLQNTAGGNSSEGSGWWAEMQENRLAMKLKAAAAAKGLKPFPRLVYGADGWRTEAQ